MSNERVPQATVLGSYAYGWQQLRKYFLYLLLVGLVGTVADVPTWVGWGGREAAAGPSVPLQIFLAAYSLLILPVINYGMALVFLRYIRDDGTEPLRDEKADFKQLFAGFTDNYLNIILANLLVVAIVLMGFVLLIVPGIVFYCRLAFVPYLVMDKRLEPVAAIEKSWNMTRGYGWRIFGIVLLAFPLIIIGLLLFGVGALFAWIWIAAAFAAMYHAVDLAEQKRLDENGNGNGRNGPPTTVQDANA